MPHQCVRCTKLYDDGANEILAGCSCGGRFFFFMKKKDIEDAKNITSNLTDEDKIQIESDVIDIIGLEDIDKPVILDLESIRILTPGKYELDIVELFHGKPLVYRVEDGKYIIDVAGSFKRPNSG
ncbi:MAG: Zn-ribbon containing protein [Nanoarchaeota archaeon]